MLTGPASGTKTYYKLKAHGIDFLTWVLPAMEHREPSSKELPESCAESALLELGALHKHKWSCIWWFGECSRKKDTALQHRSHGPVQQKPPSPTHFQILRITTWAEAEMDQSRAADDVSPIISHLQKLFAKCYLNDKQASYHNFYIFLLPLVIKMT